MAIPPAVEHISKHIFEQLSINARKPVFAALQGPQGSGKSFLTDLVRSHLSAPPYSLKVVVLSVDDLYLPHEGLRRLAESHADNPLWRGRGQPGTHDVDLGLSILQALKEGKQGIELPRFEKSLFNGEGDRLPMDGTGLIVDPPFDVFIMEGWFMGFYPISPVELQARWDGVWAQERRSLELDDSVVGTKDNIAAVNEALFRYVNLWGFFDVFIQLSAASTSDSVSPLSTIYKWRLEQEHYMKARNGGKGMTDAAVKLFVDRYIPGYVFFSDGISKGYVATEHSTLKTEGNHSTAAQLGMSLALPKWIGRSLRITIDEKREVVGLEKF